MPFLKRVAEKVGAPLDITGKTIEFSYRFESSRMLGPAQSRLPDDAQQQVRAPGRAADG